MRLRRKLPRFRPRGKNLRWPDRCGVRQRRRRGLRDDGRRQRRSQNAFDFVGRRTMLAKVGAPTKTTGIRPVWLANRIRELSRSTASPRTRTRMPPRTTSRQHRDKTRAPANPEHEMSPVAVGLLPADRRSCCCWPGAQGSLKRRPSESPVQKVVLGSFGGHVGCRTWG